MRLGTLWAAAALMAAATGASAQDWPSRAVHLILPYAPGATADAFARPIGPKLSEALGQPVVIENRPGAAGALGSAQVAKAAPDGYTLLVTFSTPHYSGPFLMKAVSYDPARDFTPIIAAASIHTVLAVHPSHPARTMAEFLSHAKGAPDGVLYGTGGLIVFGEVLAQSAGIRMVHVPYKGGGPMLTDLLGGQITVGLTVLSSAIPLARSGKLRVLALLSDKPSRVAPEIPVVTQTVPTYSMPETWVGLLGPAKLPRPIVQRLHAEVQKIINTPEIRDQLNKAGFETTGTQTPDELAAAADKAMALLQRVTANAKITPQ